MSENEFLSGSEDYHDETDQRLTKWMKNHLLQAITMARLNTSFFKLIDHEYNLGRTTYRCSGLKMVNSEYFCLIYWSPDDKYSLLYCPHKNKRVHRTPWKPWPEIYDYFKDWVSYLQLELELPDLWAELERASPHENLPELSDTLEAHYTYDQVEQLTVLLNRAKKEITERFDLQPDQTEYLSIQIDYLVDQAKKQPIRNWRNILIGTLVSTAINLSIPQDSLPIFWSIVRNALESIRLLIGM